VHYFQTLHCSFWQYSLQELTKYAFVGRLDPSDLEPFGQERNMSMGVLVENAHSVDIFILNCRLAFLF
jgi:hypothetical protein